MVNNIYNYIKVTKWECTLTKTITFTYKMAITRINHNQIIISQIENTKQITITIWHYISFHSYIDKSLLCSCLKL